MSRLPKVPKQNRSPKGTGEEARPEQGSKAKAPRRRNTREQGHQGNVAQNTTNQGYQQDR
jgi:hypothetical protein